MSRIPKGCDQQGRYPEAAECCTEIGADDGEDPLALSWALLAVALTGVSIIIGNLLFWFAEWISAA